MTYTGEVNKLWNIYGHMERAWKYKYFFREPCGDELYIYKPEYESCHAVHGGRTAGEVVK